MYTHVLIFHIACGSLALLTGLVSFTASKGQRLHILSGKAYTLSMIAVALSAFALSLMKFSAFLFIVGLFTLYMTLTGYRALQKNQNKQIDFRILTATSIMLLIFLSILGYQTSFQLSGMLPVLLVFVSILSAMLFNDWRRLRKSKETNYRSRLRLHIARMGGAYIATITAFVVTNVSLEPVYLKWLTPTAVGSLAIAWFQYRYTARNKKVRQAA